MTYRHSHWAAKLHHHLSLSCSVGLVCGLSESIGVPPYIPSHGLLSFKTLFGIWYITKYWLPCPTRLNIFLPSTAVPRQSKESSSQSRVLSFLPTSLWPISAPVTNGSRSKLPGKRVRVKIQRKKQITVIRSDVGQRRMWTTFGEADFKVDASLVPILLDHLTNSTHVKKEEIKYVCHRVWVWAPYLDCLADPNWLYTVFTAACMIKAFESSKDTKKVSWRWISCLSLHLCM